MITEQIIQRALFEIHKGPANSEYFFKNLTSPEWIKPLSEKGYFKEPPPPEKDGDYIRFPPWPESEYLARMAKIDPEGVLDVILKLPDTDNIRVHEDIVEAACAMGVEHAAKAVKMMVKWIHKQDHIYLNLPLSYGNLISHLATGGYPEDALKLAKAMLYIAEGPKKEDIRIEGEVYSPKPEPKIKIDSWNYEQVLKKNIPDIVHSDAKTGVNYLCALLENAVKHSTSNPDLLVDDDISYMWRPAVEDSEQNRPSNDLTNSLVTALRDAVEHCVGEGQADILETVERREYKIFKRIGMHVRRVYPNFDQENTISLLLDEQRWTPFFGQPDSSLRWTPRVRAFPIG